MSAKTPWPHQVKGLDLVRKEFQQGNRWVCVVAPTGSGKTVLGSIACAAHLAKKPDGKCLWVAHREELVTQAYDTLTESGLMCGVIQSTPSREVNPYRPVQIASIQTLVARNIQLQEITFFVYDEAHHGMSNSWNELALYYKQRGVFALGLTATPIRGDGLPMGDLYDAIVKPVSVDELIRDGFLVDFEIMAPSSPLAKGQIAQSPVDAWSEFARGRRTIVFAQNCATAAKYVDEFRAAGVSADWVHGKMDAGQRRSVLNRYANGEFLVLCNVGVLTEGFDDRLTSCAILARSVGSLSLYLQICGRPLRCAAGKTDAIIIDLHGSSHKHGSPRDDREWSLDGDGIRKKKLAQATERFCLFCGCLVEDPEATICPDCGEERPGQLSPEIVNAKLVRYAAKRREDPTKRASTLARWITEGEAKNYKPGRAAFKYKAVYGEFPPVDVMAKARSLAAATRTM